MSLSTAAVAESTPLHATTNRRPYRLDAIDVMRGIVMVIMALDHARDFLLSHAEQDPMANPHITGAIFVTRWITHFCAPVFVLLAGVSAGLMAQRKSAAELARFLLLRGGWLILVEILVISTLFTFSPLGLAATQGLILIPMQVIWAIGASMVILSGVQFLGRAACLSLGIILCAGHNLLDPIWPPSQLLDQHWPLWVALHSQMSWHWDPLLFRFSYPLLPWVGVMTLGFGASGLFLQSPSRRNSILRYAGFALTAGFVLLRAGTHYGDPHPWQTQPAGAVASLMSFLNTTKYPPSLDFLLMTLGPAALLCSFADRISSGIKDVFVTFGRVPFAFYVAHFFLIHSLSVLLGIIQGFALPQMLTLYRYYPKGYGVPLAEVYAAWALVVILLYPFCRWLAAVKARRRDWWLSYV